LNTKKEKKKKGEKKRKRLHRKIRGLGEEKMLLKNRPRLLHHRLSRSLHYSLLL
jgi:hypothetical protein